MSMGKMIVYTIIVNFTVFGSIYAETAVGFDISQYEGVWYIVGFTTPTPHEYGVITCYWIRVTKTNRTGQHFKQEIMLWINGKLKNVVGFGNIVNSEIRLAAPETTVGTVTKYNRGYELILHDELDTSYFQLMSRFPAASTSTKVKFEQMAATIGANVTYIAHSKCLYDH